MTKCSAPNCFNSQKSSEFTFYEFPKENHLRSKWIASIGRPNWTPGRRSMICSVHFEKKQFKTKGHFQLIEGAVPTLFQSLRKKRGTQVQKRNSLSSNLNVERDSGNTATRNLLQKGSDNEEESTPIINSNSYARRKFVNDMVVIDGTYILENCEIDTDKQSSNLLRCISSTLENEISSSNSTANSVIKCFPQFEKDDRMEEGTSKTEDVIFVDSSTISNADSEFVLVDANYQSKSEGLILLEQPSEEALKPPLNISEIAVEYSASFSATCYSDEHTDLNSSPPVKRQRLNEKDCELPVFDSHHLESASVDKGEDRELETSDPSIQRGAVDLPVSLPYHVWGKHAKENGYVASMWQHGTFMCRLCGVASNKTVNIFSNESKDIKLLERITSILPIMIVQSDDLPQNVCSKCLNRLDSCSELIVTSYNTHRQLASVMGQDLNQGSQLSIFFHERKKESTFSPDCKRHLLLMEICDEDDKPVEEYLAIALEDLQLRLHPKTNKRRELQCSLVLAAISNNSMVSQLEQAKTAAEALVTMSVKQTEGTEQSPFILDKEGSGPTIFNFGDISTEQEETVANARLNEMELIESLPIRNPPDETVSGEDQAMPVTDDVSPSDCFSTGIRHPKFQKGWRESGVPFKTLQDLVYWKSEDDEVKLTCRICDKIFEGNFLIQDHVREHLGPSSEAYFTQAQTLNGCGKNETEKASETLYSWSKTRLSARYQCSFCTERLDSKQNLKQHLQDNHAGNTKCDRCEHDATDVCEAISHRQKCMEIRKMRAWECQKCLETFSLEEEVKKHQVHCDHVGDVGIESLPHKPRFQQLRGSHSPPDFKYQCSHCPKRYINSSRLKEHMQKHEEKKYMCKVCGKLFSTKQILRQHEFTHGDPQYLCALCSRTFYRKSHLLKHMNVHNPDNSRASRAGPQPHRDGLNRCRECKNVFEQKELLFHYKSSHPHIQLQNYTCEICKEENTSYAELFQHQREVHKTGVKDCPFCEKTIDSSTQMKYHLMKHEGMYPYNCPMCNNGYTANSVLQDHIRRKHTGEKPFECQQCSKRFPSNGALAQHSTVHSLPHQLLPCPVCNIGFKRKAHLDVHVRTHTGEKPYPCPICDRPFRQRPDCVKHVRVIHGEDPSKYEFRFHPNMSISFPQVVSVSDMELVLEGEDLMQASL